MAEAAVEDRPETRFFCHKCSVEFVSAAADYTCPHCAGGFIEALEAPLDSNDDGNEGDDGFRGFPSYHRFGDIRDWTEILTMMSGGNIDSPAASPPNRVTRRSGSLNAQPRRRYASQVPGYRIVGTRPQRIGGVGVVRPSFENLLTDVVLNLTGGGSPLANQMFIVGNPADYAWGREGVDAIVTHLLNQMDGTGPPPMPKERIVQIPTVAVTQEQVTAKLQCSVCWEDFVLDEPVRSLPCLHVYHEACICPWLELHATCPICRKSLTEEAAEAASNNSNSVSNGLAAFFRQNEQQQGGSEEGENHSDGPPPRESNLEYESINVTTPSLILDCYDEDNTSSSSCNNDNMFAGPSNSSPNSTSVATTTTTTTSTTSGRPNTNIMMDIELDMDIDFD